PPATIAPAPVEEPLTSPRNLAKISVGLGLASFLLPIFLGVPGLILGGLSYLTIRRSNGLLPGKGLALTGLGLNLGSTVLMLLVLMVMGIRALFSGSAKPTTPEVAATQPTVVSPATSPVESTPPPPDRSWKVIFRSSDASIWNDDVNKGPDHFAMSVDL